ncbi:MAG: hypothetical protein RR053_05640 [Evtepia sp.]
MTKYSILKDKNEAYHFFTFGDLGKPEYYCRFDHFEDGVMAAVWRIVNGENPLDNWGENLFDPASGTDYVLGDPEKPQDALDPGVWFANTWDEASYTAGDWRDVTGELK